jgi:plastocyanin
MNKNILIGLVVVLLVIGGVVMVQNRSNDQVANNTSDTQEAPTDTSVVEEESVNENDAMVRDDAVNNSATEDVVTVTLTDEGFSPQEITVKAGSKVVWKNNSGDSATVDSSVHPTHRDHPELNLGNFEDGEEHSLVFEEPGTYRYHDHLNASRFGTVVVE